MALAMPLAVSVQYWLRAVGPKPLVAFVTPP
jgi:hypothetical protein